MFGQFCDYEPASGACLESVVVKGISMQLALPALLCLCIHAHASLIQTERQSTNPHHTPLGKRNSVTTTHKIYTHHTSTSTSTHHFRTSVHNVYHGDHQHKARSSPLLLCRHHHIAHTHSHRRPRPQQHPPTGMGMHADSKLGLPRQRPRQRPRSNPGSVRGLVPGDRGVYARHICMGNVLDEEGCCG